jgi:hypothetical protein
MIHNRGADREIWADHGRRWCTNSGLLQIDHNLCIQSVRISAAVAKADDVELDRRQKLKLRRFQDSTFQVFRQGACTRDHRTQRIGAVDLKREPCLQRPEATRKIGTEVARPRRSSGKAAGLATQIGGGRSERVLMKTSVANDYEAGIVGNLRPFVKI